MCNVLLFYLSGAVSSSATPRLTDTEAPQPTFTVMIVVITPPRRGCALPSYYGVKILHLLIDIKHKEWRKFVMIKVFFFFVFLAEITCV